MQRLYGKVCLITGAAQGLGKAMAQVLAREGAVVIAVDINLNGLHQVVEEISQNGGTAVALKMDVRLEDDWRAIADYLSNHYGWLDVLVNNAGIELVKPIEDIDLSEWQSVQNINVDGVFLGCKTLLTLLKKAGLQAKAGASIINISSVAGIVAFANQLAYNTSKGAVRHLSKSLAVEFAEKRYNIRVNSVHPGFIDTPMLQDVFARWAEKGFMGSNQQEVAEAVAETQPLGRFGEAKDVAHAVLFLASEESSFVTGSELLVDGAWTAR